MGIPELDNDESVILQAHNIKVKSVVFDAVLTNKRLILVDSKKGLIPPQEILIATINAVDGGENAIRDPILTFSMLSRGATARQMILTFPREASGERRRERDDWLKSLKAQIELVSNLPTIPDTTTIDQPPSPTPGIVPPSQPQNSGATFPKKKIEITRPRRNIIEPVPAMPRPIETTTLPIGSFCSRCGNRVPPESVFCNLCGTKVVTSEEQPAVSPVTISTTPVAVPPVVPQVQVSTPPVFGQGGDRKERTIEEVIHSIEPLIEDSVPRRSEAAPLVPRHFPAPPPIAETPAVEAPAVVPQAEPPAQPPSAEPVPAEASPSAPPSAPPIPTPLPEPIPVQPPQPPRKKPRYIAIAIVAIVFLAIIGGIVIFLNSGEIMPGDTAITPTPTTVPLTTLPTPTPVATIIPTITQEIIPTPTSEPEVAIPPNGVWVRITYSGKYVGTYGTPGSQTPVSDTGDHFYMVSTINGPVEASIQKMDGTSNALTIEVYKNGELMKSTTTVLPKGIIEFQVDLKPKPTPTPTPSPTVDVTPAPTAALNSTANATGTA